MSFCSFIYNVEHYTQHDFLFQVCTGLPECVCQVHPCYVDGEPSNQPCNFPGGPELHKCSEKTLSFGVNDIICLKECECGTGYENPSFTNTFCQGKNGPCFSSFSVKISCFIMTMLSLIFKILLQLCNDSKLLDSTTPSTSCLNIT